MSSDSLHHLLIVTVTTGDCHSWLFLAPVYSLVANILVFIRGGFSGHIGSANTLSSLWIILAHPASATGACHLTLVHALRRYHNDNHINFIIVVSCILLSDHSHFLSRPSLEHPNSVSLPTPQDLWSIYLPHFHCPLSYFPAFCSMNSMDSGYKQIIAYTFRFSILCSSYFLVKTTILSKI